MNDGSRNLNRVLAPTRRVSVASVLLRTLEALSSKDEDQVFTDLYNELKPFCEERLRRKERG